MFPPAFFGGVGAPELVIILFVFSLPVALVLLAGVIHAAQSQQSSTDRALEELRIAYARGEVDDDEFERRKRTLETEGRD
ncbi:SHOCT domain-containing protein [Haloarchaeobius iranensis]|uniref:Putative membrane protein n=1 Tax=Haloarchaeobius iranensis TaxID=996166 RepID=A0A1G9VBZ2_9EURY|nr:SHOCT domain-containing protein [Haloarchaeobius iranensis]SDM69593.1 putative membrane protein [Haloarchaeobius iranensis]